MFANHGGTTRAGAAQRAIEIEEYDRGLCALQEASHALSIALNELALLARGALAREATPRVRTHRGRVTFFKRTALGCAELVVANPTNFISHEGFAEPSRAGSALVAFALLEGSEIGLHQGFHLHEEPLAVSAKILENFRGFEVGRHLMDAVVAGDKHLRGVLSWPPWHAAYLFGPHPRIQHYLGHSPQECQLLAQPQRTTYIGLREVAL